MKLLIGKTGIFLGKFCIIYNNKKIIIHNASFDLSFLDGELSLIQKEKINKKLVIDSLEVARNKFPGSQVSLDALCKRFRIDNSKRVKHTALVDCDLLSKVYINLIGQREPTLDFQNVQADNFKSDDFTRLYYKKIVLPFIFF